MPSKSKSAPAGGPLSIVGEMNIYRAGELQQTLLKALAKSPTLEVDLSAVTEFDTAGLQLLLASKKSVEAAQGALHLVNPSSVVTDVLELLQLDVRLEPVAAALVQEGT